MARPLKSGLDFFPVETDIGSDPKITKLIRRGGSEAFTVFMWVLILTYRSGYYSEKDVVVETIAWNFRDIPEERVAECMDIIADCGLLHRGLYEQGILTSHGIQVQYEQILKRRKSNAADMQYWIIEDNNSVNVNNNSVSVSNNSVNVNNSTQTENKQKINRKENKIKQNKTENKTENKEDRNSDSSDSFHSSFSDLGMFGDPLYLSRALEEACGGELPKNTQRKMGEWLRNYDHRSIGEAYNLAVAKGAHSIVGYMDTVLRKWSLGDGSPKWIEREEQELAREKEEYMKPGALGKILVNGHEALGT